MNLTSKIYRFAAISSVIGAVWAGSVLAGDRSSRAFEDLIWQQGGPGLHFALLWGDWNEGDSPYDVAVRYRLADVPIFTVPVGSQNRLPDVALEPVDPPAFAIVGRPIEIPISIESAMPRDVTTTLTLSDANGVIESRPLLVEPTLQAVSAPVESDVRHR